MTVGLNGATYVLSEWNQTYIPTFSSFGFKKIKIKIITASLVFKSPKSLLAGLFLKLIPMLIDEQKSNFKKLSQHCCEIKEIYKTK